MRKDWLYFCSISIAGIVGLIVTSLESRAEWKSAGLRADWGGRDFACSQGPIPKPDLCNAATKGLVAVCWPSRKTGECNNAVEWCTYKKVTLSTRPDGSAPGEVYTCN